MGFDDSLPIERYQNPKSKNTVFSSDDETPGWDSSFRGDVFSATSFLKYIDMIMYL
jgi:hypothetical protein